MPHSLLVVPLALWIALGFCFAATSGAADWPRLGGPDGAGVSFETNLARSWPAAGPRVLWTVDLADGFAGAAVRDSQVYVLDRLDDQQDVLRGFDLTTGRELWQLAYEAPGTLPYNGSRNVPTVDEQYVFLIGPWGHFHCVARRTHQIVWARHLVNDFKDPQIDVSEPPTTREEKLVRAQVPMWGLTQAPLLYRDTVIAAPQTQKTGLVAYEKSTGKIRWQSDYIGRNWYSHVSPYLTTLCGIDQIIMLGQPSDPEKSPAQAPPAIISSLDPVTGRILWTSTTPGPHKIPMPQPVRIAQDRLFITGGYGLGCLGLQVSCAGGRWETKVLFHKKTAAAFIHSPVLYQDKIYVISFKEHGGASTGLVCLNRDGDPLWQTGPGLQFDFGPLLIADGLAFVMHGKTGELHLFDLGSAEAKLLAKARVLTARNNMVWAPLALAEGKLIVRDQHEMKCLDVINP